MPAPLHRWLSVSRAKDENAAMDEAAWLAIADDYALLSTQRWRGN
jgi:hypothetical protein